MSQEDRQKWKLKMYNYWQDTLEERLAGVKAAKAKLEEQIEEIKRLKKQTLMRTKNGISY